MPAGMSIYVGDSLHWERAKSFPCLTQLGYDFLPYPSYRGKYLFNLEGVWSENLKAFYKLHIC